ncbi:27044_t:CDS:2, partial [Dentiscutata erythropus]
KMRLYLAGNCGGRKSRTGERYSKPIFGKNPTARSCSPPPSYEETISLLSRESSFSSRRSQSTSPVRSSFCEEDNNRRSVVLWGSENRN